MSRPISARLRPFGALLALAALLAAVSVGCSLGQVVVGRSGQPSTPTKTPRPTFTPLPGTLTEEVTGTPSGVRGVLPPGVTVVAPDVRPPAAVPTGSVTPGAVSGGGATNLVLIATETPEPSPTPEPVGPTPTPTGDVETNRPTPEGGPRAVPTPYVVVNAPTLNGRRGPGANYERIGEAKKGDELMIMARSTDGKWWQVCCMANQPVWVAADLVSAKGAVNAVGQAPDPPTPTPRLPTAVPPPGLAPTATPTRGLPFDIARGPEFPIQRDNGTMTIWVKVYEGPADNQTPLGGYILKVARDGVDVTKPEESFGDRPFDKTAASEGGRDYNLKFEMNDAGEAEWEIYLARPGGFRVSPITKFTTKGDSYRNLVIYIAYWLAR